MGNCGTKHLVNTTSEPQGYLQMLTFFANHQTTKPHFHSMILLPQRIWIPLFGMECGPVFFVGILSLFFVCQAWSHFPFILLASRRGQRLFLFRQFHFSPFPKHSNFFNPTHQQLFNLRKPALICVKFFSFIFFCTFSCQLVKIRAN